MKLDNVFELVSREHYQSWHSNKLNSLSFEVRKDFTQADITKGKLVYYTTDLSAYNQKYIEKERAFYFYIQADDAILTESQFVSELVLLFNGDCLMNILLVILFFFLIWEVSGE